MLFSISISTEGSCSSTPGKMASDFGDAQRHRVPADDSCLFHSLGFLGSAFQKHIHDRGSEKTVHGEGAPVISSESLREACASVCEDYADEIVLGRGEELQRLATLDGSLVREAADPESENDLKPIVLEQYKKLIRKSSTWGDDLEARMILEKRFPGLAIDLWNLETGFSVRIPGTPGQHMLGHVIHTGSHFDPVVIKQNVGSSKERPTEESLAVFPADDEETINIGYPRM